jgi:N-acyl-phosphatidylethanolamine-hydrolysing phospholipase D
VDGRYLSWAEADDKGTLWVRLKFLARRLTNSLTGVANLTPLLYASDNPGLAPPANSLTWIGHATFLIRINGVNILTDPIWSAHTGPLSFIGPPRLVKVPIQISELPPIDLVVISHNHFDHLDTPTLRQLAEQNPQTHFLVPADNAHILHDVGITRVSELNWGDGWSIGDLTITCLPAQHWSRRTPWDGNQSLWASWSVQSPDRHLYFAGDTAYQTHFKAIKDALGSPDIALLPIGAYQPVAMMKPSHLDPEEAVQAGLDLGARTIVSMHYGTYDLSDEPIDEPPLRFSQAAETAGYSRADTWNLAIGESRSLGTL